tara:strand:- start:392 stop:1093 length:702 start_codon:yes stop_codon:yes gene_type:complete
MSDGKFQEIKNSQGPIPQPKNAVEDLFFQIPAGKEQPGLQQCGPVAAGDDTWYTINNLGFRGQEFEGRQAVVGDSYVFGIGVDTCFAEQIGYDNLGTPAASNDLITRRAIQYIHNYSPDELIVVWTYGYRREWITPDGEPYEFKRKMKGEWSDAEFALAELSNYDYDTYSWFKNRWLLMLYADVAECDIREYNNHTIDPTQYSPPGKDGKHPGQGWHDAMAQMILDRTPRVPL